MHPIVEIRQPNGTELFVSVRNRLEIGRECSGLLLDDPQVSRRHLALDVQGGVVIVEDLGSTNGSTLDGQRITAPIELRAGSTVACGETTIRLEPPAAVRPRSAAVGSDTVVADGAAVDGAPTGTVVAPGGVGTAPAGRGGAEPPVAPQRPVATDAVGRHTSIDVVAQHARDEGVDVAALPADQGTITIVFSDIESSSERNVALGDQAWFEVLGIHNKIVADRVAEYGGTIVKNQGDGFMLSFPGARTALDCMCHVQRDLAVHASSDPERAVRIRIGLHTGEVLADADGDIFGQHVVVAARVANLALGGEILVSALTKEIVASRGDITFGAPREVNLKGIGDAIVYPMEWQHT